MHTPKLYPIICAASILSVAALAQAPTPIEPPAVPGAPAATPAVIEPPIQLGNPAVPAVPGTPLPGAPAAVDPLTPSTLPPTAARVFEFQNDDVGLVLRTLARQAGVNLMISDKVGTGGGLVQARLQGVTPMQAIQTVVENKGLIIEERTNGTFFVMTKEEKATEPAVPGSYTFSYAQAKDALPLLQTQLVSGMAPQFDQRTNTIFFRESKSSMEKAMEFLATIDKPTRQVMIEARLVEVTANPNQSYGINWAGVVGGAATPQTFSFAGSNAAQSTFNNIQTATGNNSTTTTNGMPATTGIAGGGNTATNTNSNGLVASPTNLFGTTGNFLRDASSLGALSNAVAGQFAILSVPQMSATLRFLNEDRDAEFLANPRVVTANNQKAEIKIVRKQPVPQLNFNEQTATAQFSGFEDKEFGNTLIVTPTINKEDFVTLMVKPEISNKVGDATFTFAGSTVTSPVIDTRTLESNVLIRSGDTLAIGGLLQDEMTKARTKVPFLGDIPILGYAFQERVNQRTKRNLLIFVTPTVIDQGYGTGLEDQVTGVRHTGNEFADPNGWRNNAKGAWRLVPTSNRQNAAEAPMPGVAKAPRKTGFRSGVPARER